MIPLFSVSLPLHDPLFEFTVLISIILVSPFLFRLIKVPDVAAYILMGILFGPYGLRVLNRDSGIELLGTFGLLYIMFMAGLELDPDKLKTSRRSSLIFGISTFLLPFMLGWMVCQSVLHLSNQATLLVSIMFSTHTLVAYPIARRLGVNRDMAALTAIGGTIITDTLVLLILSVATQDFQQRNVGMEVAILILSFASYTAVIFYTFPRIAKFFFRHVKRDRPVHYLFLLFMVSISSYLARLIGTEPIIGAFLAGLALNRSIPKNSMLMHHVDFVGNILFIPVFLIGLGMLINLQVLFTNSHLWYVALILIVTAFAGKWLAAFLSGKILGFSPGQRNLLFGLTSSHAAATVAIMFIGFEKGMIDQTLFYAAVLIIMVSSLAATLLTERAGKRMVLNASLTPEIQRFERILVPISNPATMSNLIGIANCFQKVYNSEPIYILSIVNENSSSRENILHLRDTLEQHVADFNYLNENHKVITRVDLSISSGIIRAAKEYLVSDIVFGWGGKSTASQRIFGNTFDHLFLSLQTLFAVNIRGSHSEYHRFIVHLPSHLEYEPVFRSLIRKINALPKADDQLILRPESKVAIDAIKEMLPKRNRHEIRYENTGFNEYLTATDTLHIFFLLRKQSVAYNAKNNARVQKLLASGSPSEFILVVPGFE